MALITINFIQCREYHAESFEYKKLPPERFMNIHKVKDKILSPPPLKKVRGKKIFICCV